MIRHYYAGAAKVRMELFENDGTTLKKAYDYMGGMVYVQENGTKTLDFVSAPEGRLLLTHKILETLPDSVKGDKFRYEYSLRDHLGNTRVSCRCGDPKRGEDGNILSGEAAGIDSVLIVQENHYDPWGLSFGSANESQIPKGLSNRFQYNGKEKIADMDLGWSDYGARMYDPSIGRWNVVDPLTESQENWGVYHYVYDNPVKNIDPDGRQPCCSDLVDLAAGIGNAFVDNISNGLVDLRGKYKPKNKDAYNAGLRVGDIGSQVVGSSLMLSGGADIGTGTAILTASATVEGSSAGAGTVIAAPGAAAGGTIALAGIAKVGIGAILYTNGSNNSKNRKGQVGSYTNTHKSGKKYHGKGDKKRAKESGKQKAKDNNDPLVDTDWTSSRNDREAFKDEARRLENDGGHRNPNNYNKRASPGSRYKKEDEL